MRTGRIPLAGLLCCLHLWFGVIPAWTTIETDFPNYYTSARLVMERGDLSRLYDTTWFQNQIYNHGIDRQGIFSPLPPVSSLIMVPVAMLEPQSAQRVWTLINLLLLGGNIALLSRCTGRDWQFSSLLFLGSGIALINDIRFGQVYLLISLLVLAGYHLSRSGRSMNCGIAFGIAAALKYYSIGLMPFYAVRREWKIVAWCLGTVAGIYILAIALLGPEVHRQFLALLPGHLGGEVLNPFGSGLQSWNSLFRRLFVFDASLNPDPVVRWEPGYYLSTYGVALVVLLVTVYGWRRAASNLRENAPPVQFALMNLSALLLLPASSTYLFLLAVFPVALLLSGGRGVWRPEQKVILVLFILMSWIPYRFFRPFDGRGILTVVAYPRLGLLLGMFIVTVFFIRNNTALGES